MLRKVFKKSKWIHKWFGLILILFLIWMSISGILLNHPDWIASYSVPDWMVPPQYIPHNWNRSSLTSMVFSKPDIGLVFAGGKQGIWRSIDGGKSFQRYESGFEKDPYYKKTQNLFLVESGRPCLFAATDGGLYVNDLANKIWRKLKLSEEHEAVRKILKIENKLYIFSESNVYGASGLFPDIQFKKLNWTRNEPERRVTLIDLFFHLHDGRFWGLPGKLLFDFAGLIIIFLSFGAFYIWYFPNHIKRLKRKHIKFNVQKKSGTFRLFYKYHLKLGIWMSLIILLIGGTGFFMRPPALVLIAYGNVPAWIYPGALPQNPWEHKVINAMYDSVDHKVIIDATDGVWMGPADFSKPFIKKKLNSPLFVMGATVFEPYGTGGYLIGSFNGLYHLERSTGRPVDMINGGYISEWSDVQPADYMVTAYFKSPGGDEYINTHEKGLIKLPVNSIVEHDCFQMPESLSMEYKMSLWNFMFELHNGRIFKDWIGGLYILLIPLGSLFFILIILSGIYDWFILWQIKRKTRKERLV